MQIKFWGKNSFAKDVMISVPEARLRSFAVICFITRLNVTVSKMTSTTIHSGLIFSTRCSVMCKIYTGYHGTSDIEHGLCACTIINPRAKARGLSLRTGAQTMLYLSLETPVSRLS